MFCGGQDVSQSDADLQTAGLLAFIYFKQCS
jgi:hypothetical protein